MSARFQWVTTAGGLLLLAIVACEDGPAATDAGSDAGLAIDCAQLDCSTPPRDHCLGATALRIYDHRQPGVCEPGIGCVHGFGDVPCRCEADRCPDLPAVGEQRVAVLLIDFINSGYAMTVDEMREVVFTGEYSLDRFYQEASYGRTWLSGDVFGWYPVSSGAVHCHRSSEELLAMAMADIPSYLEYNRFLLLYRAPIDGCEDYGLGESTLGQELIDTPDGPVLASLARVEIEYRLSRPRLPTQALSQITASVVGHELGHSLGLRAHANLFDCGTEMLSTVAGACRQEAIADMFSLMAGEGYRRSALHQGACHKRELGWLVGDEVFTVDTRLLQPGAPVSVVLGPYEQRTADRATAARIVLGTPIPVTTNVTISEIFVENRTAVGFDSWIGSLETDAAAAYDNMTATSGADPIAIDVVGVQLRGGFYLDDHCITTYLLDPHPNSLGYNNTDYSLYDALDGFLNIGQQVVEPASGVIIRAVQRLADGSVEVAIGRP